MTDESISERARAAARARWEGSTQAERSAQGRLAAAARWEGHTAAPRATRQDRACPFCGEVVPMKRNQRSCGATACRLARNAERARERFARLGVERLYGGAMSDDDALRRWWDGLSSEDRERARGLSAGDTLPGDLLVSMTRAGMPQAAAWWPSSEAGPRFTVPDELVRFAQGQRMP